MQVGKLQRSEFTALSLIYLPTVLEILQYLSFSFMIFFTIDHRLVDFSPSLFNQHTVTIKIAYTYSFFHHTGHILVHSLPGVFLSLIVLFLEIVLRFIYCGLLV